MKYEVGDKVKIINTLHNHGFDIGETVVIYELFEDDTAPNYYAVSDSNPDNAWYVEDDNLE